MRVIAVFFVRMGINFVRQNSWKKRTDPGFEMAISRRVTLLKIGVIGSVITAICCFTSVLVVIVVAVGLAWITGYLDYVLFPLLFVFLGITVYSVWLYLYNKN